MDDSTISSISNPVKDFGTSALKQVGNIAFGEITNSADYKYIGANATYTIHYKIEKGPIPQPQQITLQAPMSAELTELNDLVSTVTNSASEFS